MADLPDILELVTPKALPGPLAPHPLFKKILAGEAPPFIRMSAGDRSVVEGQVEEALSRLPEGVRRAVEHSVWHRTIGKSDDPRYDAVREMGPGSMGIKALTTCVMILVERTIREQKAAAKKPAAGPAKAAPSQEGVSRMASSPKKTSAQEAAAVAAATAAASLGNRALDRQRTA